MRPRVIALHELESNHMLARDLSGSGIVFLGEKHQDTRVLQAEMAILELLHSISHDIIVGLEHFNYRQQHLIDGYFEGTLSWEDVKREYAEGYEGFDLDFYRPLLDYARSHGIRVYGIMVPREYAKTVAREGFGAAGDPVYGVEPRELWLGPDSYRSAFMEAVGEAASRGPMARFGLDRLFLAQAYKDEVAARRIAGLLAGYPHARLASGPPAMLVVMGAMHVAVEGSVPSRVSRLIPGVSYRVVVASPDPEWAEGIAGAPGSIVDYVVVGQS